jgi:hypothetical protein
MAETSYAMCRNLSVKWEFSKILCLEQYGSQILVYVQVSVNDISYYLEPDYNTFLIHFKTRKVISDLWARASHLGDRRHEAETFPGV